MAAVTNFIGDPPGVEPSLDRVGEPRNIKDDFKLSRVIGTGASAQVYLANLKESNF